MQGRLTRDLYTFQKIRRSGLGRANVRDIRLLPRDEGNVDDEVGVEDGRSWKTIVGTRQETVPAVSSRAKRPLRSPQIAQCTF